MYNRYIPQPDGSYRRNRVGDISPSPQNQIPPPPPCSESTAPPARQEIPRLRPQPPIRPVPSRPKPHPDSTSVGSFLRQLLPKNFDTEDLLIVLLLLLMSGDCREDQNTALLTLVLYLFM